MTSTSVRVKLSESPFDSPAELFANLAKIVSLLDEAVARDPNFVLAYCAWPARTTLFTRTGFMPVRNSAWWIIAPWRKPRCKRHDACVRTRARFIWHRRPIFNANSDPEQARIEVDLARHRLPNNAEVEQLAGRINRTQGRWDDAIRCLQRAIVLDPRDLGSRSALARPTT